uniref:Uncharacterized protein n=1 Tax=Oryza rufipogon TaxID=4529 RepID=A0A0E0N8E4_ORYRU
MGSLGLERLVWRSMLGDVSKEELVYVQVQQKSSHGGDGGGEEVDVERGETRQRSRPRVARQHGTMGEFEVKTGHDDNGD